MALSYIKLKAMSSGSSLNSKLLHSLSLKNISALWIHKCDRVIHRKSWIATTVIQSLDSNGSRTWSYIFIVYCETRSPVLQKKVTKSAGLGRMLIDVIMMSWTPKEPRRREGYLIQLKYNFYFHGLCNISNWRSCHGESHETAKYCIVHLWKGYKFTNVIA